MTRLVLNSNRFVVCIIAIRRLDTSLSLCRLQAITIVLLVVGLLAPNVNFFVVVTLTYGVMRVVGEAGY